MKIKSFALATCGIALYSCMSQRPIALQKPPNNDTYTVEYLFEHDGCKVYRFLDRGNCVYFTNCNGDATAFSDSATAIHNRVRVVKKKRD